jgi:hypothetical protein
LWGKCTRKVYGKHTTTARDCYKGISDFTRK